MVHAVTGSNRCILLGENGLVSGLVVGFVKTLKHFNEAQIESRILLPRMMPTALWMLESLAAVYCRSLQL